MTQQQQRPLIPRTTALVLAACAAATALLSACAPLVIGGAAVGTALVISDRRTSGAQLEDEGIELRAASSLRDALGDRAHINITSYNRKVLLTGEAPDEQTRRQAEQIAGRVDNVRGVFNELAVAANTNLSQRSNDVLITGKVKASLVDAADVQANAFKVVTERGIVYLMGRVTPREADRATQIARTVGGVQRVIRLFELITEDELRRAQPAAPAQGAASSPRN